MFASAFSWISDFFVFLAFIVFTFRPLFTCRVHMHLQLRNAPRIPCGSCQPHRCFLVANMLRRTRGYMFNNGVNNSTFINVWIKAITQPLLLVVKTSDRLMQVIRSIYSKSSYVIDDRSTVGYHSRYGFYSEITGGLAMQVTRSTLAPGQTPCSCQISACRRQRLCCCVENWDLSYGAVTPLLLRRFCRRANSRPDSGQGCQTIPGCITPGGCWARWRVRFESFWV